MKAYLITYDLKVPGRDYATLYTAIKSYGNWWHFLESNWIIVTNETSTQVWNRLAGTIDRSDFLLIIEVRRDSYGWLPPEAWKWITTYVPA
ncbi:MAG TPA: hypothetical protein VF522_15395 [Ramlibacter sp.]|uniref:hypothetical protein n=1 Tax=Ramlibacter sp. TaxID=1917967 RepID=UPI002ED0CD58